MAQNPKIKTKGNMQNLILDTTQAVYIPQHVRLRVVQCSGTLLLNHSPIHLPINSIGPGLVYPTEGTVRLWLSDTTDVVQLQLVDPHSSDHPMYLMADTPFQVVAVESGIVHTWHHSPRLCADMRHPFAVSRHVHVSQYVTLGPDTGLMVDCKTSIFVHGHQGLHHDRNIPPFQWVSVQGGLVTTSHDVDAAALPYPRTEGEALVFRRPPRSPTLAVSIPYEARVHVVRTGAGTFRTFVQHSDVKSRRWAIVGNTTFVHNLPIIPVVDFHLFTIVHGKQQWLFHPRMHSAQRRSILQRVQAQLTGSYILNIPRWLSRTLVGELLENFDLDKIVVSTSCQDTVDAYTSTLRRYLDTSDYQSAGWNCTMLRSLLKLPDMVPRDHVVQCFHTWLGQRIVYAPSDVDGPVQKPLVAAGLPPQQIRTGPYHLLMYYAPVEPAALPWGQSSLLPDGHERIEIVERLPDGVYGVVHSPTTLDPVQGVLRVSDQGTTIHVYSGTVPDTRLVYFIPCAK
jgi:hypothetical protein